MGLLELAGRSAAIRLSPLAAAMQLWSLFWVVSGGSLPYTLFAVYFIDAMQLFAHLVLWATRLCLIVPPPPAPLDGLAAPKRTNACVSRRRRAGLALAGTTLRLAALLMVTGVSLSFDKRREDLTEMVDVSWSTWAFLLFLAAVWCSFIAGFYDEVLIFSKLWIGSEYLLLLGLFRFYKHPKLAPKIREMKSEIVQYNSLVNAIKPAAQRVDAKGKDTFDLQVWWKGNCAKVPACAYALRAVRVLTNSPNSIPPERVFSILNDTFDDDQKNGRADYKGFSLMKQYTAHAAASTVLMV